MRPVFRHVGLVARSGHDAVLSTLRDVLQLLDQYGIQTVLEVETAEWVGLPHRQRASLNLLGEMVDLVIVVGGDGSLLRVARMLAVHHKPVVGVNRGRLGFLTDISPDELTRGLLAILGGDFSSEERFLLQCLIRSGPDERLLGLAFNDVVLYPGKHLHMVEFELFVDGQFVYRLRSDGLIMATPTGSTAYALSGGGPIMHPRLDAIVLVPMHPHTLSSRPIVIDGNSEIKILVLSRDLQPMVGCDGQEGQVLAAGDWIYVRKYPHRLQLLHPPGHDFFKACRTKLGWSSHQVGHAAYVD